MKKYYSKKNQGISDTFYLGFIAMVSIGGFFYIYNDMQHGQKQVQSSQNSLQPMHPLVQPTSHTTVRPLLPISQKDKPEVHNPSLTRQTENIIKKQTNDNTRVSSTSEPIKTQIPKTLVVPQLSESIPGANIDKPGLAVKGAEDKNRVKAVQNKPEDNKKVILVQKDRSKQPQLSVQTSYSTNQAVQSKVVTQPGMLDKAPKASADTNNSKMTAQEDSTGNALQKGAQESEQLTLQPLMVQQQAVSKPQTSITEKSPITVAEPEQTRKHTMHGQQKSSVNPRQGASAPSMPPVRMVESARGTFRSHQARQAWRNNNARMHQPPVSYDAMRQTSASRQTQMRPGYGNHYYRNDYSPPVDNYYAPPQMPYPYGMPPRPFNPYGHDPYADQNNYYPGNNYMPANEQYRPWNPGRFY